MINDWPVFTGWSTTTQDGRDYSFAYTGPPTQTIVTLKDAKANLVVDHCLDDEMIKGFIRSSVRMIEQYTGLTLSQRTARIEYRSFPGRGCAIELYKGPVVSVQSVVYDGATATTGYTTWLDHSPPLIEHTDWPVPTSGRVVVNYTTGFTAETLPASLKDAILLMTNHLYYKRGDGGKMGAEELPTALKDILDLEWTGRYA